MTAPAQSAAKRPNFTSCPTAPSLFRPRALKPYLLPCLLKSISQSILTNAMPLGT